MGKPWQANGAGGDIVRPAKVSRSTIFRKKTIAGRQVMVSSIVVLFAVFPVLLFPQETYVGSKNSDKYHLQSCQWAKRISLTNLVTFDTPEAASEAGYVPCKVCKPPSTKSSTTPSSTKEQVKKESSPLKANTRCTAITKKGTRCKRKAEAGSAYCWQHKR